MTTRFRSRLRLPAGEPVRVGPRRAFLKRTLAATAAVVSGVLRRGYAADGRPILEAGQGVADITPPLGVELAGFHRPPGQERRVRGIRQPTAVRALALRYRDQQAVLVSADLVAMPRDYTARVQQTVAAKTGIPAAHVRLCCTHSHSTPSFVILRQWGGRSAEYMETVAGRIVEAVQRAQQDLAPAEVYVGRAQTVGGNFNRTTKTWKTDREFSKDSTDDQRWLDTLLQVLRFERGAGRPALAWYHFSAHAVCFTDEQAGPDWPGLVATRLEAEEKLAPSFLQGHCGDVNPGDGNPWIGDPQKTSQAVYTALRQALQAAQRVPVDAMRLAASEFAAPLDLARFEDELARYRREPGACTGGEWVDAGFAQDWAVWAATWDRQRTTQATPLSALRLGEVGFLFHSAELYSGYGLTIRRDAPCAHTLVVGYTDDILGYLPDPAAYQAREYAAIVVPKILNLPPFTPEAGRALVAASQRLWTQLVS
jgi:neutral ceramidase